MTSSPATDALYRSSADLLSEAVHQNDGLSVTGILERSFTFAFRSMVYPQIWEDPRVDVEALEPKPGEHLVGIASGGCNILSYLVAAPVRVTAIDLNPAHIALNKLKLAALKHLPDHAAFFRFCGSANDAANVADYDRHLRSHLDEETLAYWEGSDIVGRRRVTRFARGFHRFGLLGRCIGAGHLLAKLYRKDPRKMLDARSLEEQRAIFRSELAPLFDKRFVRWILGHRMSLYGLGIPPAQYVSLAEGTSTAAEVVRARLERLRPRSVEDIRAADASVAAFSAQMGEALGELKAFLFSELYRHSRVMSRMHAAESIVRAASAVELEDVRKLDSTPAGKDVSKISFKSANGLNITFRIRKDGDAHWLSITAVGEGDAMKQAGDVTAKTGGWEFKLPASKTESLLKRRVELLDDKAS